MTVWNNPSLPVNPKWDSVPQPTQLSLAWIYDSSVTYDSPLYSYDSLTPLGIVWNKPSNAISTTWQ